MTDGPVAGLILAAGASRRMGRPKLLLEVEGRPLIQHAVDAAARSTLDPVVVVLGSDADAVRRAVRVPERRFSFIVNEGFAEGQSSSLRVGLGRMPDEVVAAAILLADQPAIGTEVIDTVVARFFAGDKPAARPVYTSAASRIPGHPVVLARSLWPELMRLEGDQGARAILARHPERLLEIELDGAAPEDIDTPEAYRRALDRARDAKARE